MIIVNVIYRKSRDSNNLILMITIVSIAHILCETSRNESKIKGVTNNVIFLSHGQSTLRFFMHFRLKKRKELAEKVIDSMDRSTNPVEYWLIHGFSEFQHFLYARLHYILIMFCIWNSIMESLAFRSYLLHVQHSDYCCCFQIGNAQK